MAKKKEDAIEKFLEGIDFKNLKSEEITGENGLLKLLTKRVIEKAMNAEMDNHLGYPKHDVSGKNINNSRNGKSKKTLTTEMGNVDIDVPSAQMT